MANKEQSNSQETEMLNPVEVIKNIIWEFILEYDKNKSRRGPAASATSMIRLNTEKLSALGDLSFVCDLNIWQEVLYTCPGLGLTKAAKEIFELVANNKNTQQKYEKLIQASAQTLFPVKLFDVQNGRIIGFLQRPIVIKNMINIILENEATYGQHVKNSSKLRIKLLPYDSQDKLTEMKLGSYRALLLHNTMEKLLKYSSIILIPNEDEEDDEEVEKNILQVQIINLSQQQKCIVNNNGHRNCVVKCAAVINPITGKIEQMTAHEYNNLRANDMLLMARHKYGLRVRCDEGFMAHIQRIGEATATVDLLEVKHSSPVHTKLSVQGSTRGASFILYNSARLETLLRIFDERVCTENLPALPNISEIDFTLLREEEEWQLIYAYLFTFPQLIENCLENLEKHSLCASHLIIRFLSSFVGTFSAYYRRVRILTDGRATLLPVLYARIYLLKAVRIVLNKGLELLNIQPVNFM